MERTSRKLRTADDLDAAGLIAREIVEALSDVTGRYAVAITPDVVRLIDRDAADDPIARQFVPDVRELDQRPEERADPIGDVEHEAVPGVVHRYTARVLMKLKHVCPV